MDEVLKSTAVGNKQRSIVAIGAYFGPLPTWSQLLFRSMSYNKDVNFVLFTDQTVINPPENLTVVTTSLTDLNRRFQKQYDFKISLNVPYKVCDFRPAFGEIFSEEIGDAAFWGHFDLDVVFGSITENIPAVAFEQYDKILIRGNFALYRNQPSMNGAYREAVSGVNYRDCFSSPAPYHFDEWGGIAKILSGKGVSIWDEDVIFDIRPNRYRTRVTSSSQPCLYMWEDGKVTEHLTDSKSFTVTREAALIHLQKRKMTIDLATARIATSIVIGPSRFDDVSDKGKTDPNALSGTLMVQSLRFHSLRAKKMARRLRIGSRF